MASIQESIMKVRNMVKGDSNDFRPSDRFIYSILKDIRNLYLKREVDQLKLYNSSSIQFINNLPLQDVSKIEACGITSGCTIKRSVYQLPKRLDTKYGNGNNSIKVFNIDGSNQYDLTTLERIIYSETSSYKINEPKAFIRNDYLYIVRDDDISGVMLSGIFEDPEKVFLLNQCITDNNLLCTAIFEIEFPIPGYLKDTIYESAVRKLLGLYKHLPIEQQTELKK